MGVQSLQPPYLRPLERFSAHELYVRSVFTSSTQPWWSLVRAMAVDRATGGSLPAERVIVHWSGDFWSARVVSYGPQKW